MNEWTLTPSGVITALLAVSVGLLAFFGRKYVEKLDALDAQAVRKHDLKEFEERMEESRRWMHEQNQHSLREINDSVKDTRKDLNTLTRDIMNRGGGR